MRERPATVLGTCAKLSIAIAPATPSGTEREDHVNTDAKRCGICGNPNDVIARDKNNAFVGSEENCEFSFKKIYRNDLGINSFFAVTLR